MAVKGRHLALCCTAETSKGQLDDFFKASLEGPKNDGQEVKPRLVFVTDLQKPLDDPTEFANNWTSSPILGQSFKECCATVKTLAHQKGSVIDSEVFAVLNEESFETRTVFFVEKADEDDEPIVGKGWWHVAQWLMGPIRIKKPDLGEMIESVKDEGGVIDIEFPDPSPKKDFKPSFSAGQRVFLLDNGQRWLLVSRDAETDFVGRLVSGRDGSATVVRELFGDEKNEVEKKDV